MLFPIAASGRRCPRPVPGDLAEGPIVVGPAGVAAHRSAGSHPLLGAERVGREESDRLREAACSGLMMYIGARARWQPLASRRRRHGPGDLLQGRGQALGVAREAGRRRVGEVLPLARAGEVEHLGEDGREDGGDDGDDQDQIAWPWPPPLSRRRVPPPNQSMRKNRSARMTMLPSITAAMVMKRTS